MRLIDADQMAVDETEAYMAAQEQIDDPYWQRVNLIVHAKVQKLIADTPTIDAMPVVRCRECIHFDPECDDGPTCSETEAMLWPNEDDFCSRGQRRDQFVDVRKKEGEGENAAL